MEESLLEAARRELKEETGLENIGLIQVGAFGAPDRDPRGRVVSICFTGTLPAHHPTELQAESDAAEAGWHPVHDLPELAFDHDRMIVDALRAAGFIDGSAVNIK